MAKILTIAKLWLFLLFVKGGSFFILTTKFKESVACDKINLKLQAAKNEGEIFMQVNEFDYYERIGNWNFDDIKCVTVRHTDWEFYDVIRAHTNATSNCLDLGTGGGEKVLEFYPEVGMVTATDFSSEMIKTANENLKKHPGKRVKFAQMDNLNMKVPNNSFDLISARHTVIHAKQIYDALVPGGVLVIEGVDQKDCWEMKELFGRGQAFNDPISIAEKDYQDLVDAGFSKIERVEILEDEYYETEDDLMALLLKAPILDDFSEFDNSDFEHKAMIEKDLFDEYVRRFKSDKGILLKRVLYGIVATK